jgi:hypothetical protein
MQPEDQMKESKEGKLQIVYSTRSNECRNLQYNSSRSALQQGTEAG